MELAVRPGDPIDQDVDWKVEEKNRSLGPISEDCGACICDERSKIVLVKVPPCIPGITCQTDTRAFSMLEACYVSAVTAVVSRGASSVAFPAIGTRWHHWGMVQSAAAARRAVEAVYDDVPDNFRIVFAVGSGESLEIWDGVLTF